MILPSFIEGGVATFYLGGYGVFDGLAASALMKQKETYPHIELILVLAYLNREIDASRYDGIAASLQKFMLSVMLIPEKIKEGSLC